MNKFRIGAKWKNKLKHVFIIIDDTAGIFTLRSTKGEQLILDKSELTNGFDYFK